MFDRRECEWFLENWLSGEDPSPAQSPNVACESSHLDSCPECAELVEKLTEDQSQLKAYFSHLEVPPVPELELRDAMTAASGYPRRLSLTLYPILGSLLLSLLIVAAYWLGTSLAEIQKLKIQEELEVLNGINFSTERLLSERVERAGAAGRFGDRLRDGRILDLYGNPYLELPDETGYYSAGPNGIDEFGRGDDITVEPSSAK